MNELIVAGIINLNTGEITDATALTKDKTAIRLKVRDELGCKHGRGGFMAFEFGSMSHMDYYRKQMINKCPSAFRGLQLLNVKYRIAEINKAIDTIKLELELAESVADDCAKLYQSEEDKSKLAFINDLTEDELREIQDRLDDVKSTLNGRLRYLKELEAA
jgi:hypothetical protein